MKAKQILAIAGIAVLAVLYIMTFVFAIIDNPETMKMLGASVAATVIIPVMMWAGLTMAKRRSEKKDEQDHFKE